MLPMQSNGKRRRLPVAVFGLALASFGLQSQAQSPDAHEGVYNGEVGRIINENCVVCHREGGIGPMQFETYEQVRPVGTANLTASGQPRNASLTLTTSISASRIWKATGVWNRLRSMRSWPGPKPEPP